MWSGVQWFSKTVAAKPGANVCPSKFPEGPISNTDTDMASDLAPSDRTVFVGCLSKRGTEVTKELPRQLT